MQTLTKWCKSSFWCFAIVPVNIALAVPAHGVVALEAGEAVGAVVGLAQARVRARRDVADEALASVEKCMSP